MRSTGGESILVRYRSLVFDVLWPVRWRCMGIAAITLGWAVEDTTVRPYVLKLLIDGLTDHAPLAQLGMILALYASVRIGMTVFLRAADWLLLRVVPTIKGGTVEHLFAVLLKRRPHWERDVTSGSVVASVHAAAEGMPQLFVPFVGRFLGSICRVGLAVSTVWIALPSAAWALALWVVFLVLGGLWWASRVRLLSDAASGAQATLLGVLVDTFTNRSAILMSGTHEQEMGQVTQRVATWVSAERARDWQLLILYCVQGVSFLLLELVVLGLAVRGHAAGVVSVGDIGLLIAVHMVLIEALWDIPQEISQFVRSLGRVTQGFGVVERMGESVVSSPLPCAPGKGVLECRDIAFAYPQSAPLFTNLSLHIPAGQRVGLVGPSGSGKSTLVRLFMRMHELTQGSIMLDGTDIASCSFGSLQEKFAYIPQAPELFCRSIRENMTYGTTHVPEKRLHELAQAVGMHDTIMSWPRGYDTLVGERGMRLSGGQRQAVVIARALLRRATIVIWDEATSAIDSHLEQAIHQALDRYGAGVTTLIIAHRLSTLIKLDRILVLDNGRIVEDGTHDVLLKRSGVYQALWDSQVCLLSETFPADR